MPHARLHIVAAAVAIATLAVLLVAYRAAPSFAQSAGDLDSLVFHRFQGLETDGEASYRWSKASSTIVLPQVGNARSELRLDVWYPSGDTALPLTLYSAGRPLTTVPVSGRRAINLLLADTASGDVRIELASPTWRPAGDARDLGVAVERVAWRPLEPPRPPLAQLIVLPALAAALFWLVLGAGGGRGPAVVAGLLAVPLAALAALRPLEVAPFTPRLLLLVLLAHIALFLWSALGPQGRRWRLPSRVDAVDALLLLGIGYWMLLIFQWVLYWDTGAGVRPRPGTHIVGTATLVAVAALALVPRLSSLVRRRGALASLAAGGLANGVYATWFAFRRHGPDFFIWWRAAYDFHLGRPLYRLDDLAANAYGHVFKQPPFFGMLFLPLATGDDLLHLLIFRIVSVALYVLCGWLFWRLLRPRLGGWVAAAATAIVLGLMQPAFDTLAYGQTDIVLLLLLLLALYGLRDGRHWLIGLCLALGGMAKVYPLLAGGMLLARRDWRSIGWLALWLVVLNGAAVPVMGWQNHLTYLFEVLPAIRGTTTWLENQSVNGFASRLLTHSMRTEPISSASLETIKYLAFGLGAALAIGLAALPLPRRGAGFALQFGGFATLMLLVAPAAWMHYATITALPMLALIWSSADAPLSRGRAAVFAASFALIGYGNQYTFFDGARRPGLPELALSFKFYGLVLLWCLTCQVVWSAWRSRQTVAVETPADGLQPAPG